MEDHEDTLRTFARLLRKRCFEVAEASGVSGAIKEWRPGDLLLSDIGLPDGDGHDLMRQLGACGVRGIAISGFGTAKDREEYKRAGFAESFVKPVDVDSARAGDWAHDEPAERRRPNGPDDGLIAALRL